jgi:hypothetical protein
MITRLFVDAEMRHVSAACICSEMPETFSHLSAADSHTSTQLKITINLNSFCHLIVRSFHHIVF